MGPGCFHPRNMKTSTIPRAKRALQWGRDVSIPEIARKPSVHISRGWLQWGRDVSIPEMPMAWSTVDTHIQLQWGRDVSIPEMPSHPHLGRPLPSFNGAGMFPSQKSPLVFRLTPANRASMGPGCFHPRNLMPWLTWLRGVMLQWGRDVSIPEIRLASNWITVNVLASMGPGCFHPRNCRHPHCHGCPQLASMGPGCFHPRNGVFYVFPLRR